jgi:hypothetical protein
LLDLVGATGGQAAAASVQHQAKGTSAPVQRKTADEIRTEYQVKDDETALWSPKLGGLIPIPFAPSATLTKTEGKLLDGLTVDMGLMGLSEFKAIKEKAFSVSEAQYPAPSTFPAQAPPAGAGRNTWINNDGHRDAFRHCYWNALLTKNFGEKWARQFANNEVGRGIASANKSANDKEIANLVKAAVSSARACPRARTDGEPEPGAGHRAEQVAQLSAPSANPAMNV